MTTKRDRSKTRLVGILFGEKRLHGCRVSVSTLGRVRHEFASIDLDQGDLCHGVDRLLDELNVGSKPVSIVGALPINEGSIVTLPDAPDQLDQPNAARLHADTELSTDTVQWKTGFRNTGFKTQRNGADGDVGKSDGSLTSVIAAPNQRVDEILKAISQTPHRLERLAPAECCLIAHASQNDSQRHNDNFTTRVFVGEKQILTIVCRKHCPVHWESTPLPAGDEGTAIVDAVRLAETACQASGLNVQTSSVVIHGRPELALLIDRQWLDQQLPADYRWTDTPSTAESDVVRSLVESHVVVSDNDFNLIRQYREPVALRRLIPWNEVIAYTAAACVLAAVLGMRIHGVQAEQAAVSDQIRPSNVAAKYAESNAELLSLRDQFRKKSDKIGDFVNDRVRWSSILSDISRRLPDGTELTGIQCTNPLSSQIHSDPGDHSNPGKTATPLSASSRPTATPSTPTLTLNAQCVLEKNESLPGLIASLSQTIREIESVSKHFDSVELKELRQFQMSKTGNRSVQFALVLTQKQQGAR